MKIDGYVYTAGRSLSSRLATQRSAEAMGKSRDLGGKNVHHDFADFALMFCPDWLAKTMKLLEPLIERIPFVRELLCSVYFFVDVRGAER